MLEKQGGELIIKELLKRPKDDQKNDGSTRNHQAYNEARDGFVVRLRRRIKKKRKSPRLPREESTLLHSTVTHDYSSEAIN